MKPITMNTESVRGISDGRKTQTRRPIKDILLIHHAEDYQYKGNDGTGLFHCFWDRKIAKMHDVKCPFGKIGDKLYVKEKHRLYGIEDFIFCEYEDGIRLQVASNDYENPLGTDTHWLPSIHMPQWASRITLEIIDIRVERVASISYQDIHKEGFTGTKPIYKAKNWFKGLWNSIYKNWNDNPWVWVIEFNKETK